MNTHTLKLAPLLLALVFSTAATSLAQGNAASGTEVLTNDNVITMVKAGLPPSIIVNKIRTSKTNFNTTTNELIQLQQTRVPAEIINAMVAAATATSTATSQTGAGDVSRTDPNDPLSAHEAGIYLYEEIDGKKKMTQLEPSVTKQTKTGGIFASAMTYGIMKTKVKAALAGKNAPLQLSTPKPVFYFYFEAKNSGLSHNTYYATSPSEFVLVQFNAKSNTREITILQANAFGAQSGTMDKSARGFKVEKLGPGVYKVTPQQDLADGEYGFYNGGGVGPSGGAKIFDFGIKLPR